MEEEVKEECLHENTYMIPVAGGFMEVCMECNETMSTRKGNDA